MLWKKYGQPPSNSAFQWGKCGLSVTLYIWDFQVAKAEWNAYWVIYKCLYGKSIYTFGQGLRRRQEMKSDLCHAEVGKSDSCQSWGFCEFSQLIKYLRISSKASRRSINTELRLIIIWCQLMWEIQARSRLVCQQYHHTCMQGRFKSQN